MKGIPLSYYKAPLNCFILALKGGKALIFMIRACINPFIKMFVQAKLIVGSNHRLLDE